MTTSRRGLSASDGRSLATWERGEPFWPSLRGSVGFCAGSSHVRAVRLGQTSLGGGGVEATVTAVGTRSRPAAGSAQCSASRSRGVPGAPVGTHVAPARARLRRRPVGDGPSPRREREATATLPPSSSRGRARRTVLSFPLVPFPRAETRRRSRRAGVRRPRADFAAPWPRVASRGEPLLRARSPSPRLPASFPLHMRPAVSRVSPPEPPQQRGQRVGRP